MSLIKSPQYRIGFFDGYNHNEPVCESTANMTTAEYLDYRMGLDEGRDERTELESVKEDAEQTQEKLEDTIDGLKDEVRSLEQTVADLESSLDDTMADLHEANNEIADLQSEIRLANQDNEHLQTLLSDAQGALADAA